MSTTKMKRRFLKFDETHPKLWRDFEARALYLARTGVDHHSAWEIATYLRTVRTADAKHSIPNDYIAYYARKFKDAHPEYSNFFTLKSLKDERAAKAEEKSVIAKREMELAIENLFVDFRRDLLTQMMRHIGKNAIEGFEVPAMAVYGKGGVGPSPVLDVQLRRRAIKIVSESND